MLDRLAAFAGEFKRPGELRWHVNLSTQVTMRKGVLLSNGQSRGGGVSARLFEGGLYGFAATPHDDAAAIRGVIGKATENAASVRVKRNAPPPAASVPGEGVFDYRSAKPTRSASERVEILKKSRQPHP